MQDAGSILTPLDIPKSVKADAWDAFAQSKDENDLTQRLQNIGIPKEAKAALWDLKRSQAAPTAPSSPSATADDRTAMQVAKDQVMAAAKGAISPITSIPDQIAQQGIFKTLASNLTPVGIAKGIWGGVKAVGEDVVPNIVKNSAALVESYGGPKSPFGAAPLQAENERATGTAGATAGGLAIAEGLAKAPILAKLAANKVTTPSNVMSAAAAIRDAGLLPADAEKAIPMRYRAAAQVLTRPTAAAAEGVARWMANDGNAPIVGSAVANIEPRPPIDRPLPPRPTINQAQRRATIVPPEAVGEPKLNIPRPGPQISPILAEDIARNAAQNSSPLDLEAKPPAAPSGEIPFTPPEDFAFKKGHAMGTLKAPEVNKWMGVRPDDVTHGANPGQRILDEGLLGATREATKASVDSSLKGAGMQLEARLKAMDAKGVTVDAQTPIADAYAKLGETYGITKDVSTQAQAGVIDKIEARFPDLTKLKPSDAHRLKVELGNSIDWKNSDNPVNQMMKQVYRGINDSISSADESVSPIQKRWGDLYIASRNLSRSIAGEIAGTKEAGGPTSKVKFGFGLTQP